MYMMCFQQRISYSFCFLFVIIMVLELPRSMVSCACPLHCQCSPSGNGQTVSCGTGLGAFPVNLPSDTDVLSLNPSPPGIMTNTITILTSQLFKAAPGISRLHIRRCGLHSVEAFAFSSLTKLVSLDLSDNMLTRVTRSALSGILQLQLLDITGNARCSIDPDAFYDLKNIRILRLGRIGIKSLGKMLTKLVNLHDLDLHGNELFRLESASFSSLSNLKHIDVSHNILLGIQEDLKPILTNLSSLALDSNPWRCNCAISWVKRLPTKFLFPTQYSGDEVICDRPMKLEGKYLINVPDSEFTCLPSKVISCSNFVRTNEASSFTVSCKVEGDPFPDITWVTPSGVNLSHSVMTRVQDTAILTVTWSAFSLHHGPWTIIAESYKSVDSKMFQVEIITTTLSTPIGTATKSMTRVPSSSANNTTTKNIGKNNQLSQSMSSSSLSSHSGHLHGSGQVTPMPSKSPVSNGNAANALNSQSSDIPSTGSNMITSVTADSRSEVQPKPVSLDSSVSMSIAVGAIVITAFLSLIGVILFGVTVYRSKAKARVGIEQDDRLRTLRHGNKMETLFIVTNGPEGSTHVNRWTQ